MKFVSWLIYCYEWIGDPLRRVVANEVRFARRVTNRAEEMLMFSPSSENALRKLLGRAARVQVLAKQLKRDEKRWLRQRQWLDDQEFAERGLANATLHEEFLALSMQLRSSATQALNRSRQLL